MSDASSEDEGLPETHHAADGDDTNAVQQVGEFVSLLMNSIPGASGGDDATAAAAEPGAGPSNAAAAGVVQLRPKSSSDNGHRPISSTESYEEPLPPLEYFPLPPDVPQMSCNASTCPNSIRRFITEARSLFSYYQRCLKLIELSTSADFGDWDWLDECMNKMAQHPRVSDNMKLRYFLHNKDNAKTFRLIQKNFKLNLDDQFYMGKMNLLHIACDTGWANLARELVLVEGMNVNLPCPSKHMRPGNLTPLMLAAGAGHTNVVRVLLQRDDLEIDQKDKEGFTALFHSCNHGTNRVGDQHGYFRRLWSWDLSQEQLRSMERIARDNARQILQLLITHGCDFSVKDNSGATVLYRASTVESFEPVIKFLIDVGCRLTYNILNWTRVKNPACVEYIESELSTPKSLLRQCRLCIWKSIRLRPAAAAAPAKKSVLHFRRCLDSLGSNDGLPFVLVDYMNCR